MGRKILIFGNFPFNERNEFIDTNHFATYFARRGDEVDFVTPPAYVADFFLPFFDKRLRVLRNFFKSSVTVEDNLYQHTILSFLPVRNNFFLGSNINMSLFSAGFRVSHISKKEYDICITSQGFMLLWTQYVKSGIFIYRYNDILDGFSSNPSALNLCENNFIRQKAPLVLAVNKRLAQYLSDKYPDYTKIEILPNGVDTELFENAEPDAEIMKIHKKKMVFCGGIDFWVDTGLLYETARQLSDSVLILIGPAYTGIEYLLSLPNVVYLGPKKYSEIPSLLKACDIGLIPFKKGRLTEFVEKPLKYYEYLAAGLPVVATGLAHSDDKSPYLKNLRDPKLFIEAIRKTDIMNSAERIKISLSVKDSCWKNVFLRLENFIGKETN